MSWRWYLVPYCRSLIHHHLSISITSAPLALSSLSLYICLFYSYFALVLLFCACSGVCGCILLFLYDLFLFYYYSVCSSKKSMVSGNWGPVSKRRYVVCEASSKWAGDNKGKPKSNFDKKYEGIYRGRRPHQNIMHCGLVETIDSSTGSFLFNL